MKRMVDDFAAHVVETLPEPIRVRRQLEPLGRALRSGHFPETEEQRAAAWRRLVFDDFFLLELGLAIRRHREGRQPGLSDQPARAARRAAARRAPVCAHRRAGARLAGDPDRHGRARTR